MLSEKMATMKTLIKSIKTIKPSLTQTSRPQTFKLSLLDELCPDIHFNVTFFYLNPNKNSDFNHTSQFLHISQHLQDSLSETLNLFYPIAGRYLDGSTIACNDEGVVFIETETHYSLSEILASPDHHTIEQQFLPSSYPEVIQNSTHGRPLMLINFVLFRCGGIGMSISVSHKIFDLASLMIFLNSWTATCSGSKEADVPDLTIASSLLPPRELAHSPNKDPPSAVDIPIMKYNMRRFVFSPSKITELKNKLLSELRHDQRHENGYLSRVDVVLTLVCKSIISSLRSVRGSFRPMLMAHATNLRTRMDPLLSKYAIGNLAWPFSVLVEEEKEVELNELIKKMMAYKECLTENSTKIKGEGIEEALKQVQGMFSSSENDLLLCSSWCNFQMFEVDFGMGNPVWMTSVSQFLAAKFVQLVDTKEVGGVEALVFLEDKEMAAFETNEELLQFAMLKTNVI